MITKDEVSLLPRSSSELAPFCVLSGGSSQQLEKCRVERRGKFFDGSIRPGPRPFIEVTFLHKICRIYLGPTLTFEKPDYDPDSVKHEENTPDWQRTLQTVKSMVLDFCRIPADKIGAAILVDVHEACFVRGPLKPYGVYFLVVALRGTGQERRKEAAAFLGRYLFSREGRDYRVKRRIVYPCGQVQELELNVNRGNPNGFACPVLGCAKSVARSCDLVVHFHVEVDLRPFRCEGCSLSFRRQVLLKNHLIQDGCPAAQPNELFRPRGRPISDFKENMLHRDIAPYVACRAISMESQDFMLEFIDPAGHRFKWPPVFIIERLATNPYREQLKWRPIVYKALAQIRKSKAGLVTQM